MRVSRTTSMAFIIGKTSTPVYDNNFPHMPNTGNCKQNIVNECLPIEDSMHDSFILFINIDTFIKIKLPKAARKVVNKKKSPYILTEKLISPQYGMKKKYKLTSPIKKTGLILFSRFNFRISSPNIIKTAKRKDVSILHGNK